MGLKYHQPTFDLLKQEPVMFPLASTWLENFEAEIGQRLPPSVREWYAIEGAHDILAAHSNSDHPIPLKDLGAKHKLEAVLRIDSLSTVSLLKIMVENQGVCIWAVKLDDSEDPPVFVKLEERGGTWQDAADHFSEFIYSWVWDYSLHDFSVELVARPLSPEDKAYLHLHFGELFATAKWPRCTEYRYSRRGQKIRIRSGERQADWLISASSADSFYELGHILWSGTKLPFWQGVIFGIDDESEVQTVTERLRKELWQKP